jgi:hypothetical protein
MYASTGSGTFNTSSGNLGASLMPVDANYGNCVLKLSLDTATDIDAQGPNGWGIKVSTTVLLSLDSGMIPDAGGGLFYRRIHYHAVRAWVGYWCKLILAYPM